jgi:CRISPR-associated protein Csd1
LNPSFEMALDEARTTRDYLFGRLLAIADILEGEALSEAEQNRPTNASRYMQKYSQSPSRTWKQIHELLTPYFMRLKGKANFYKNLIAEVTSQFNPQDFISDKPLTGEYLLGYYCQRHNLRPRKDQSPSADVEISSDMAE